MTSTLDGKPIGQVFGTPVTIKGAEILPLVELMDFGVLYWLYGRGHPERPPAQKAELAALATPLVAGVEWFHNLAHTAAAQAVGKPTDEFKLLYGTPRLRYDELNDTSITPRQHITRALGGPFFNLILLPVLSGLRALAPRGSKRYEVINAGWWMNLIVILAGFLPIPGLDGGAILKWGLVERGQTPPQADETVRKVNGGMAAIFGAGTAAAVLKRKGLLAIPLAFFAFIGLAVFKGWFKEK